MNQAEDILPEWHASNPHSYGGKYHSYWRYKDLDKKVIDDQFDKNDIYTRFYTFRKAKLHNPTYVYRKRELWQADVIKFPDPLMKKATGGIVNLLAIIDVFTKMCWLFPLKNIDKRSVAQCFRTLFEDDDTKPEKLVTDNGGEFNNGEVKKVCQEFNVIHVIAKGRTKAAVAERFNLTLQRLIYQRCRKFNTNNWTSDLILQQAKKIYLNRYHRTIKMTPLEAEDPDIHANVRQVFFQKYRQIEEKRKVPKFKEGDTVRISATRIPFQRGYHQNFTTEVWTVSKVLTNLPLPRYVVEDAFGEELDNILNENELVRYNPPENAEYFIDKVLKTRVIAKGKNKGKIEHFVSWLHLDKKFNSWVLDEDMREVPQNEGV